MLPHLLTLVFVANSQVGQMGHLKAHWALSVWQNENGSGSHSIHATPNEIFCDK